MTDPDSDLSQRIERLERRVSRWRAVTLLSVSALLVVVLTAQTVFDPNQRQGRLVVREIALVDSSGRERVQLGASDDEVALRLLDKEGSKRVELVYDSIGPAIAVHGRNGNRIQMALDGTNAFFQVLAGDRDVRASLALIDGEIGLAMWKTKDEPAFFAVP